ESRRTTRGDKPHPSSLTLPQRKRTYDGTHTGRPRRRRVVPTERALRPRLHRPAPNVRHRPRERQDVSVVLSDETTVQPWSVHAEAGAREHAWCRMATHRSTASG